MKTPMTLIILDGFGLGADSPENAIFAAHTPNLDRIFAEESGCALSCSGLDVGLPDGQIGNSEVGHMNIGAGRVVYQDLPRITQSIKDGTFFENEAFLSAMDLCKESGAALHLMGLLSDGGVHSHEAHLFALLRMAKEREVPQVWVHAFLDGRDTAPKSGKQFVSRLVKECARQGNAGVASLMGRFYAMDRDKRWERVQKAYNALALGKAPDCEDPVRAVEESYCRGITDEFLEPVIFQKDATVREGDAVVFFNFRPDRARELTRCFVDRTLDTIAREGSAFPRIFVSMTEYDAELKGVRAAYPKKVIKDHFGAIISHLGLRQLRIAETEKYAHVTFFLNGGSEAPLPGEKRVLIPSPAVETYDLQPEMSAPEVSRRAVSLIESGEFDVIILNFANCDMVGHTGDFEATKKAVEAVDTYANRVIEATSRMGGISILTADHGNAECMFLPSGEPVTAHTANKVPFYIIGAEAKLKDGRLADIAPTMLDLMGLEKPNEMDGETLIMR